MKTYSNERHVGAKSAKTSDYTAERPCLHGFVSWRMRCIRFCTVGMKKSNWATNRGTWSELIPFSFARTNNVAWAMLRKALPWDQTPHHYLNWAQFTFMGHRPVASQKGPTWYGLVDHLGWTISRLMPKLLNVYLWPHWGATSWTLISSKLNCIHFNNYVLSAIIYKFKKTLLP